MTWSKAKSLFATWGWVLLAVVAIGLCGAGIAVGLMRPDRFEDPWAKILLGMSQSVLAAGVVAGVMRAIQTTGYVRDELSPLLCSKEYADFIRNRVRDVVHGDEAVHFTQRQLSAVFHRDMAGSLIDSREAWRSLTRTLFRQRFQKLTDEKMRRLDVGQLIGSAEYFYEEHRRKIVLDWDDEARTMLRIEEVVVAKLWTAELNHPVKLTDVYVSDNSESFRRSVHYTFTAPDGVKTVLSDADVRVDGNKRILETDLAPANCFKLYRTTTKIQKLDADPFVNFRALCLWQDPIIEVEVARDTQMGFFFRPAGFAGEGFCSVSHAQIDGLLSGLNARYDGICLPGQGYMILIVRT